jgi:hypothetical protein
MKCTQKPFDKHITKSMLCLEEREKLQLKLMSFQRVIVSSKVLSYSFFRDSTAKEATIKRAETR